MAKQSLASPKLSYSFRSLSDATGISMSVLRVAAKAGELKIRKLGARHIIREEDARSYLQHLPVIDPADMGVQA